MKQAHRSMTLASLLAVAMVASLAAPTTMAEPEHGHSHEHAQGGVGQLKLDDGMKWATDAPLRAGMAEIQSAFDANRPTIHDGAALVHGALRAYDAFFDGGAPDHFSYTAWRPPSL